MLYRFTKFLMLLLLPLGVTFAQFNPPVVNGTVTYNGQPVEGFILYLSNVDTAGIGSFIRTVETDENGFYQHQVLPTEMKIAAHDTFSYVPWSVTFEAELNQTYTYDIELVERKQDANFAGNVSFEGTGQMTEMYLLKLPSDVDLGDFNDYEAYFEVPIVPTKWASYKTMTDENGDFSLGVLFGKYVVYVPGTEDLLPYWAVFQVTGDISDFNIIMKKRVSISGSVTNVSEYNSVMVTAFPVNVSRSYRTAFISENGEYSLDVAPGDYKVRIHTTYMFEDEMYNYFGFYNDKKTAEEADIVMVDQQDVSGIDFNLPVPEVKSFTVEGTVTSNNSGKAISGAKVSVISQNLLQNTLKAYEDSTDDQGFYSISGKTILDEDSLVAYAWADGFFAEFYEDEVTFLTADIIKYKANSTITVDFGLDSIDASSGYSISGTVSDEEGNIIPFGQVTAYTNATNIGQAYVQIDSNGVYEFDTIFPTGSTVYLQAWAGPMYLPSFYDGADNWQDATPIQIGTDNVTGIDFTLTEKAPARLPLGAIKGKVITPLGKTNADTYEGAMVFVKNKGNAKADWQEVDYVDAYGHFTLPVEGYGNYEIMLTTKSGTVTDDKVQLNQQTGMVLDNYSIALTTSIGDNNEGQIVKTNKLYTAYPNPFNPRTNIRVDMANTEDVSLVIYNVVGQKVRTLHQGSLQQGTTTFTWDGVNDVGQSVASGLYFYQLESKNNIQTKTLIFLK